MKRSTVLLVVLFVITWTVSAQQSGFVNTVIELQPGVIDFREDGISGCFRDGVLVNPSPADLEVGDVFIDVDGNAKKVTAIEKIGNDIYIDTVQPALEEVVSYAKIPEQTITFDGENYLPDTLAGNASDTRPAGERGSFNASFETDIYKNKAENTFVRVGGGVDITANLYIGGELPHYHWWTYHQGWLYGALNYDLGITGSITVSLEGSKESDPILLVGFGTPTPGINAGLGLYTKTVLEGSVELTVPVTVGIQGTAAAGCRLDGFYIIAWPRDVWSSGNTDLYVLIEPELSAEGRITQKFFLGNVISLFGLKVSEFEAGAGVYFKLSGTVGGSVEFSTSGEAEEPSLDVDASGEIGISVGVSGKVFDGKWSFSIFEKDYPLLTLSAQDGWSSPFFSESGGSGKSLVLLNPAERPAFPAVPEPWSMP